MSTNLSREPPSLFSSFDRIWIVNLPVRLDRFLEMEEQISKVCLDNDPRVMYFPAIVTYDAGPFLRKGSHGAFLSHLSILKQAALSAHSVLILQDDCDFIMPDIFTYTIPKGCDIFYGGYMASNPQNPADGDIIGAHFMGFSPRAAEAAAKYLTEYLNPDFEPDARAAMEPGFNPSIRPPIDGAFVWFRRAHPELHTVFAKLGVQRSSRTDIGDQRWFDKVTGLRGTAELVRRLLRRYRLKRGDRRALLNQRF